MEQLLQQAIIVNKLNLLQQSGAIFITQDFYIFQNGLMIS